VKKCEWKEEEEAGFEGEEVAEEDLYGMNDY
jgi:hypothetical protein